LIDIVFKGGGEPFLEFARGYLIDKKITYKRYEDGIELIWV